MYDWVYIYCAFVPMHACPYVWLSVDLLCICAYAYMHVCMIECISIVCLCLCMYVCTIVYSCMFEQLFMRDCMHGFIFICVCWRCVYIIYANVCLSNCMCMTIYMWNNLYVWLYAQMLGWLYVCMFEWLHVYDYVHVRL